MKETLQFVIEHGYAFLFGWVLVEQMGLPLPSVPIMLAAGALAGTDRLSLSLVIVLALLASLLADCTWFYFGRYKGGKVLKLLCRISLEPDSCVRRTEERFSQNGSRSLLFAKFVPGVGGMAPPLAGVVGMRFIRFVIFDTVGALLYLGGFAALGFLFADQLEDVALYSERLGTALLVVAVAALAAYIVMKWRERRRFLRDLEIARITPEELKAKLDAGEPIAVVDLRHNLDWLPHPERLPGAIRMAPEEIETRNQEIPRDRDIVLYCT